MRDEAAIKRRLDVAFKLTNESDAARIYEALVEAEDAALERARLVVCLYGRAGKAHCAVDEAHECGPCTRIRALRSAPQTEKQLTEKEGKP